jgi:hypothetical protein
MIKFPVYHKDAVKIDLYSLNDNSTKALLNDKTGKQLLEAIKNRAGGILPKGVNVNYHSFFYRNKLDFIVKNDNISEYSFRII